MLRAIVVVVLLCAPARAQLSEPVARQVDRAREVALPELAVPDLSAWRELLRPEPEELGFESICWEPSLGAGLARAAEQNRPLLLWVMNGHPLGAT